MADDGWMWDIQATVCFIKDGGHKAVALQFPDSMLGDAPGVAQRLQKQLGSSCKVYVLADTAYNPLAVDEVAALHIHASCVVHYGWASLTPVSQLPAFFVFPKHQLGDVQEAGRQLASTLALSPTIQGCKAVLVAVDQAYQHVQQQLEEAVRAELNHLDVSCSLVFSDPLPRSLQPAASSSGRPSGAPGASAQGQHVPAAQPNANTACCQMAGACGQSTASSVTQLHDGASQGCTQQAGGCQAGVGCHSSPAQPAVSSQPCQPAASQGHSSDAESATGTTHQGVSDGSDGDGFATSVGAAAGLRWRLPQGVSEEECALVWFGSSTAPALQLLQLAYNSNPWLCCEPSPSQPPSQSSPQADQPSTPFTLQVSEGLATATQVLLRRRYFLVEKAKGASIVGILAGTLAAAGFRDAIALVRSAAQEAGKKTYTFVMGKPNPAKLANFPEVEVWVMVADPLGYLLDCKEYMAPIITPHEALLAFRGLSLQPGARYPLDFGEALREEQGRETEAGPAGEDQEDSLAMVSLGGLQLGHTPSGSGGKQLAARDAAEYLAVHRQYKGLETPLTGAPTLEPAKLLQGRVGRAAVYEDEPSVQAATEQVSGAQ